MVERSSIGWNSRNKLPYWQKRHICSSQLSPQYMYYLTNAHRKTKTNECFLPSLARQSPHKAFYWLYLLYAVVLLLPVRGNLRVKQLLISVRWRVCRKKYSREWCDPIFFLLLHIVWERTFWVHGSHGKGLGTPAYLLMGRGTKNVIY